nr:hypothetical protein RKHAN_02777 [Rhizobium sp. Khangiran2]
MKITAARTTLARVVPIPQRLCLLVVKETLIEPLFSGTAADQDNDQ